MTAAQKAVSLTSYAHAQSNPRAVMAGRPLSSLKYDESRWIVEPWRLFDCCQENDGAAAVIVTTAERARGLRQPPAHILATSQGSDNRYEAWSHNAPHYGSSNFRAAGPRLFESAGLKPHDVDVAQSYENFTGGVVMSLVEHGFCEPEEVDAIVGTHMLRPYTPRTIVRPNILREHLAVAERSGVVVSREEWTGGTAGVAAPVVADGVTVAAIALIGPFGEDELRRLAGPVRTVAERFSARLSQRPQATPAAA